MQGGILTGLGIAVGVLALVFAGLSALFGTTFAAGLFFVLVSVVLVLAILIQKPKGGGLAAAFGGGGGGDQAMFGAKVGDVMTWVTVVLFAAFIGLAITLVYSTDSDEQKIINATSLSAPTQGPATTTTPTEPTDPLKVFLPDPQNPTREGEAGDPDETTGTELQGTQPLTDPATEPGATTPPPPSAPAPSPDAPAETAPTE